MGGKGRKSGAYDFIHITYLYVLGLDIGPGG